MLACTVVLWGCGRIGFDSVLSDAGVDDAGVDIDGPSEPDAEVCEMEIEGPIDEPSCSDGVDNDCDSLIDEVDPDCAPECMVVTTAVDESDNGESASPPHQGAGLSLREAITLANANGSSDCILFSGPMAITLLTRLPDITGVGGLHIDGAQEVIVEDTTDIVFEALKIDSAGNSIVGLHFRGFSGPGGLALDLRASENTIGPGVEIESCGTAIRVQAAETRITGNRLHTNEVHAIQIFDLSTNIEVSFNLLYLNLEAGVQAKASIGLLLRHNTLYGNAFGLQTKMLASDLTVENNLFVANSVAGIDGTESTLLGVDFSGFFGNAVNCQGCAIGSNSITANPLLADPLLGDFSLTSGSPAIDVGTDTGLDTNSSAAGLFNGGGPDLGAIESP